MNAQIGLLNALLALSAFMGGCAVAPTPPPNAPAFQLYEGERRPPSQVAILRAPHLQTYVESVSGHGIHWVGARMIPVDRIVMGSRRLVEGPKLGWNIDSLELLPGEYTLAVFFYQADRWSRHSAHIPLRAVAGHTYTVEAREREVTLVDVTGGQTTKPEIEIVPANARESSDGRCRVQIAQDAMGHRVVDKNGNWMYLTHDIYAWTVVARFGQGFTSAQALEFDERRMDDLFGQCARSFAAVIPFLLDWGIKPAFEREGPGRRPLKPGQVVSLRFDTQPAVLGRIVTTGGTDLYEGIGALYAVDDGHEVVCGVITFSAAAAAKLACTPEKRSRITGVARRIAEKFAELGVTRFHWPSNYYFRNGKLRAEFRVLTPGGEQTLRFEE